MPVTLTSIVQRAMGSTVEVVLVEGPRCAEAYLADRLAELERAWSRFDPASELVRLNACAGNGPQAASVDLLTAVDAALQLWRATDGWFDPTTLDVLEWSGYDRDFTEVRTGSVAVAAGQRPAVRGPQGVVVDHERGVVTVPLGVRLDLGGVGKGLAADLLARELVELGARAACVSVGGDVAAAGEHPDGCWRVPVADPAHGDRIGWVVDVVDTAVVQSNRLVRNWTAGNETRNHLINPRTGNCANSGLLGAVVLADRAWWAEGVAKAAVIAGPIEGAALIRRLARGGWLIRDDGTVTLVGTAVHRSAA